MATQPLTGLTYADLDRFPDDNFRRELIDGELIVSPAPSTRHQQAVVALVMALGEYAKTRGGEVFPAPTDVFFSDRDVVEPDVLFVAADHAERIEHKFVRAAPDLVIEVSSPSTRRLELVRKRELYERFGVPEFWYVDLEADRVEVYRLKGDRYAKPVLLGRGDWEESPTLSGYPLMVDEVLGDPPAAAG